MTYQQLLKLFILQTLIVSLLSCTSSYSSSNSSSSTSSNSFPSISTKISTTQTKKMILLEKFTADWCPPCLTAANNFENLSDDNLEDYAILINYQVADHIYDSQNSTTKVFADSRENYYSNEYYPNLFQNGSQTSTWAGSITIDEILGTSQSNYAAPTANYSIEISIENYNCMITITNNSTSSYDNLTMHTMFIEDSYTYDSAPGTNSQTTFSHHLINYLGETTVTAVTSSSSQTFSYDLESVAIPDIYWDNGTSSRIISSGVSLIVFIQNNDTNEVLQAALLNVF